MRAQELLRHPSDLRPAACAWLPAAGSGLHQCAETVLVDTELCQLLLDLERVGWPERNGGGGDVNRTEVVTLSHGSVAWCQWTMQHASGRTAQISKVRTRCQPLCA